MKQSSRASTLSAFAEAPAVVYLLPHEASYVDFLRVRKIPLQQAPLAKLLPDVQPELQRQAEADRLVMETGTKAFVSYVRAYKEHHCKFIFRLQAGTHLPAAKRRKAQEKEDMQQLQDEYALLRKMKKGKMTAAEFDKATGLDLD
ncbi:hypothetical protein ABPG75_002654 [Micractinium tetrahymenae]